MIEIPTDNQQLSSQQTLEMLQFYYETIISEYTAFNHAQIVYPLYQTFLVQLNQQLRTLEQSNIGDIAINQTYQDFKVLQKKAADDIIIQEMLFEYDEFIHPIQIQALPKLINQKQKQSQKQKKAVSCILNENCDKQEYLQVGSKSVLIHHTKDKVQSISELDENKLIIIKEFDEKSYFSQINFERNPLSDLKAVIEQRLTQSKNYYYNEAQLDDAYYVIQQAKMELQDNELLLNWLYETYGDYITMIQDKMNTMQINLNELESNGWIIEKNTKTLIIKYKIDSKNSTVTLFMDSVFEANITKLMALINEIELYQNYVQFKIYHRYFIEILKYIYIKQLYHFVQDHQCQKKQENVVKYVIYRFIFLQFLTEKLCLSEKELIDLIQMVQQIFKNTVNLISLQSIHNIDLSKDKGKFVNLILNYYVFELTPISENKCRVRAVTNSDPQCRYIPKALVALVARKMASTLFEKMQKITQNFVKSPWYPKYVENQEFYDWIDNKVKVYFSKQKQL